MVFHEKNYFLAIFFFSFFLGGGSDAIDIFKMWIKFG